MVAMWLIALAIHKKARLRLWRMIAAFGDESARPDFRSSGGA
jgi:hypothetical protein